MGRGDQVSQDRTAVRIQTGPVRRLRAGADINLPTIPDESVENDPKTDVFESPEVAIST